MIDVFTNDGECVGTPELRYGTCEDLSLEESPNLFTFSVVSLNFLDARHRKANNGFPFYNFFFRMIGSSSARINGRFADVMSS